MFPFWKNPGPSGFALSFKDRNPGGAIARIFPNLGGFPEAGMSLAEGKQMSPLNTARSDPITPLHSGVDPKDRAARKKNSGPHHPETEHRHGVDHTDPHRAAVFFSDQIYSSSRTGVGSMRTGLRRIAASPFSMEIPLT